MNIDYTFEVASVDALAGCVEIIYTSQGYSTQRIGARLPYSDESIELIAEMYAPIGHWLNEGKTFAAVTVGASGALKYVEYVQPEPPLAEIPVITP